MLEGLSRHRSRTFVISTSLTMTVLLVAVGGADVPADKPPAPEIAVDGEGLHEVELVTVGFDMHAQAPIVLLREPKNGKVVPIWVGTGEARAIAWALTGFTPKRPMTHDLMTSLLGELDATLEAVIVDDLKDHTYHGKLKIRVGDEKKLRIVDTRPSDGLALALRTGASIHVADKILEATPEYDFIPPNESQQVVHAVGLTVVKPTEAHKKEFNLPDGADGVLVTHVSGVARERGMQRGDFILQVNERTLTSPMEFFEVLSRIKPGNGARIRYLRDGKEFRVKLPTDAPAGRPAPPQPGTVRI
jgi:bifunctional DNase/RNase